MRREVRGEKGSRRSRSPSESRTRARCQRRGVEWRVAILSLSENGCLLRSPEPLLLGTRIELRFELPHAVPLDLIAETGYQLVPDIGVIFHATSPDDRAAIGRFVKEALDSL